MKQQIGTYVSCVYEIHSNNLIIEEWLKRYKIPNAIDVDKFHTTIIYSRKKILVKDKLFEKDFSDLKWKFLPEQLAVFEHSGERALVLKLIAPELIKLHKKLIALGATHDFPEYHPHITISYDLPIDFDWKQVVPPPVFFVPKRIFSEPLNLIGVLNVRKTI